MKDKDKDEQEMLRKELQDLKKCITSYFGYIFTGSGAAIYGIATLKKSNADNLESLVLVSCGVSIIISFVVLILFYKFYSHNRYAGYCMALSVESYWRKINNKKDDDIPFLWEVVVSKLRSCDLHDGCSIVNKAEKLPSINRYIEDSKILSIKKYKACLVSAFFSLHLSARSRQLHGLFLHTLPLSAGYLYRYFFLLAS